MCSECLLEEFVIWFICKYSLMLTIRDMRSNIIRMARTCSVLPGCGFIYAGVGWGGRGILGSVFSSNIEWRNMLRWVQGEYCHQMAEKWFRQVCIYKRTHVTLRKKRPHLTFERLFNHLTCLRLAFKKRKLVSYSKLNSPCKNKK